jgi:hypothetical protein
MPRYYDDELYHHGIKGQKWGVRRYQDENGRLTSAGREHLYGSANKSGVIKSNGKSFRKSASTNIENVSNRKANLKTQYAYIAAGTAFLGGGVALAATGVLSPGALIGIPMVASGVKNIATDHAAMTKSKKFAKERAASPPSDIPGLKKKTRQMTPEEDMERVNPEYKNLDQNSKSNCVMCTCAFEMRRRGYDVTAQLASNGVNDETTMPTWFKDVKYKNARKWDPDHIWISTEEQTKMIDNFHRSMAKEPNGSRGAIDIGWNGSYGGHSMAYEKRNNQLIIYDTQANEKLTDRNKINDMFFTCNTIDYARLDDKSVVTKNIHEVVKS